MVTSTTPDYNIITEECGDFKLQREWHLFMREPDLMAELKCTCTNSSLLTQVCVNVVSTEALIEGQ